MIDGFQYSGTNLIDEVNALSPSLVIDVGCGSNFFKGKIKNLIGFDRVYHENLDFCSSIKDMVVENNSVDVLLALGSLQYFNRIMTHKELQIVIKWVKPGGYIVMRTQSFVPEKKSVISSSPYRWSRQWVDEISSEFNLDIVKEPVADNHKFFTNLNRTTWWWKKH